MHQNHQEPVYYNHPDPYNDKFEENPLNPVEEDDHLIQQNQHLHLPDHRHLYNEQNQDNFQNQHLINQNDEVPDHRNLYTGQPIVVASGYKGMPIKDHQYHQPMSYKHQNLPFHIAKDQPIRPHYNMPPNSFEHHEMPVHLKHRKPVRIGSHKHRQTVNHIVST